MMRRWIVLMIMLFAILSFGCRKEESVKPLSEGESADLSAQAYDFQIYPGSLFDSDLTDLYRKAHFVLNPKATSAPPMAVYLSEDPLEEVAQWYAKKYGYSRVAENEVANFSSVPPRAYYTTGDLGEATRQIVPILEKLNLDADVSAVQGTFRGATISPTGNFPRVTLQRPYYDPIQKKTIDRTFILMVKE